VVDYDGLLELVKQRRSIHLFQPDPIPDEFIDKIVEVARWAPSGASSQPWEFLVVAKPELKEEIARLVTAEYGLYYRAEQTRDPNHRFPVFLRPPDDRPHFVYAPVFIILCGDTRTQDAFPLDAKLQWGSHIFTSSLANAYLYMHLAATSLGLGSQWVTAVAYPTTQPLVKKLLGIPEDIEIYDMMVVGYPAEAPSRRFLRHKSEILHQDGYEVGKRRSAAEVREFINRAYHSCWAQFYE
jgi:5,6-dimethylbenzimidazole synthase